LDFTEPQKGKERGKWQEKYIIELSTDLQEKKKKGRKKKQTQDGTGCGNQRRGGTRLTD